MTVSPSPATKPVTPGLISHALEVAGKLANDATDVITATAGRGARPSSKESPFDWVTDTDRTLERHTRRVLTAQFPGIPVVGEEFGADAGSEDAEYHWVVDPVDGTANYVAGVPWCAYSLALVDQAGPVVGVVADPYRGAIYSAARGRGARANGKAVRLPDRSQLAGAIVCTELALRGPWPGMADFIAAAAQEHSGVRILGSAALSVVQVALGHVAAVVLDSVHEWDVAAALAMAAEVGAAVLDRHGNHIPLPNDGLLVAAPGVADKVMSWWRSASASVEASRARSVSRSDGKPVAEPAAESTPE
ncbi:MAG TPA: inositol monophosphatase [Pseudonocardiaceae bacterium]